MRHHSVVYESKELLHIILSTRALVLWCKIILLFNCLYVNIFREKRVLVGHVNVHFQVPGCPTSTFSYSGIYQDLSHKKTLYRDTPHCDWRCDKFNWVHDFVNTMFIPMLCFQILLRRYSLNVLIWKHVFIWWPCKTEFKVKMFVPLGLLR